MRHLYTLVLCAVQTISLLAQTSTSPLQCGCGTNATISTTEANLRRGIPAYIVLRGQRFGGVFGEPVGAGSGAIRGGYDIPLFPNNVGSTLFGGGISVNTANRYGAFIGPFKAGLPTNATIIAEIVDVFGNVVTSESGSLAVLNLGSTNLRPNTFETRPVYYPGGQVQYRYLPNVQAINPQALQARSRNGRFEWEGVNIGGIAGTTLALTVSHTNLPMCGCPVQIALQGGYADNCAFATQNINLSTTNTIYPNAQGPFAVPGSVGGRMSPSRRLVEAYSGSTPQIIIGETVSFSYSEPGYNSIAVILRDRFGNLASFGTTATVSIGVDRSKSTVVGDIAVSKVTWGFDAGSSGSIRADFSPVNSPQIMSHTATFPHFKITGATANNVSLMVNINPDPTLEALRIGVENLGTFATVNVSPGRAVAIAPVLTPNLYNGNLLSRIQSRFFIGRSNKEDPRTWFYLQALDEYGNRVDGGPNAYNDGIATITFTPPENGLPRAEGLAASLFYTPNGFRFSSTNDPFVKVNAQRYSAQGTSAVAVNGLYTFNDFIPLSPASLSPFGNDVVLTFEDPNLPGFIPCTSCGSAGSPLHPPITTATTTFFPVPLVSLAIPRIGEEGEPKNGAQRVGNNILLLREGNVGYFASNRNLQTGSVRVERPILSAGFNRDITVPYTLRYVNVDSTLRVIPDTTRFVTTPRSVDLPNIGTATALQLPAPINVPPPYTSVVFYAPLPAPRPFQINALQGDLFPTTKLINRPEASVVSVTNQNSGTFFLDEGFSSQLVQFTARWSDQIWHRTPARQGLRAVVIKILDQSPINATIFDIDKTSGRDSAIVYLLDPPDISPVITNAIQDKVLLRPTGSIPTEDRIELEFPSARSDGSAPSFVFYDDNYDPMTYTATSGDSTQVRASVINSDPTINGRPSLRYAAMPGATADRVTITVRAFDGTTISGMPRIAVDQFDVFLRSSVTSVGNRQEVGFSVAPNPVGVSSEEASVRFSLREAANVKIDVFSVHGAQIASIDAGVLPSGEQNISLPVSQLPSGVYGVRLVIGSTIRTTTMTVVR